MSTIPIKLRKLIQIYVHENILIVPIVMLTAILCYEFFFNMEQIVDMLTRYQTVYSCKLLITLTNIINMEDWIILHLAPAFNHIFANPLSFSLRTLGCPIYSLEQKFAKKNGLHLIYELSLSHNSNFFLSVQYAPLSNIYSAPNLLPHLHLEK